MKTINTDSKPNVWNHEQAKGTSFSRILSFDTALTGAVYNCEISSPKGKVRPSLTVLSITPTKTLVKILLTAAQTELLSSQNTWFLDVTFNNETFTCWYGSFILKVIK